MVEAEPWVLGIDFGSSFTVAASRVAGRRPEVLEIDGDRRMPSVVFAESDGVVVVGSSAEYLAATQPGMALRSPKGRLGDPSPVIIHGRTFAVRELVAAILARVWDEAVRFHGSTPVEVRLTHPAVWSRSRRDELIRAAELAGLAEVHLVAEPVAAAISYAESRSVEPGSHIAVYDLGGGTFDVAILRAEDSGFTVVGRPLGVDRLGGELFDELVANEIGAALDPQTWESLQLSDELAWHQAAHALRSESRRVKERLSAHSYAETLLGLPDGVHPHRMERSALDFLIGPHIEASIEIVLQALADADLEVDQLAAIYLAGGASRSPLVERLVAEALHGVNVVRLGDPKTVVALGATHPAAVEPQRALSRGPTDPWFEAPPPPRTLSAPLGSGRPETLPPSTSASNPLEVSPASHEGERKRRQSASRLIATVSVAAIAVAAMSITAARTVFDRESTTTTTRSADVLAAGEDPIIDAPAENALLPAGSVLLTYRSALDAKVHVVFVDAQPVRSSELNLSGTTLTLTAGDHVIIVRTELTNGLSVDSVARRVRVG